MTRPIRIRKGIVDQRGLAVQAPLEELIRNVGENALLWILGSAVGQLTPVHTHGEVGVQIAGAVTDHVVQDQLGTLVCLKSQDVFRAVGGPPGTLKGGAAVDGSGVRALRHPVDHGDGGLAGQAVDGHIPVVDGQQAGAVRGLQPFDDMKNALPPENGQRDESGNEDAAPDDPVFFPKGTGRLPELVSGVAESISHVGLDLLFVRFLRHAPACQQFRDSDAQQFRQGLQCRKVRCAQTPLPFGDGPVRNVEPVGELLLGHALFFAQFPDERAGL